MKQILIVEDDELLNKMLVYNLQSESYGIVSVETVKEAMEVLKSQPFDLVLLDINLPDGDGYAIAKTIREKYSDTIVIFLTANDRESDEIRGYELGAVDYITKPFSIHSLQRKVENVLRMMRHHVSMQDVFDDGRLFLNFAEQTAMLGGKPLTLSTLEFRMLNLFCQNRNRVLTRKQLLEKIWDCTENYVDEHTLTTTLSRIRGKIETDGTVYIKTVYGMGYKWTGGKKLSVKRMFFWLTAGMTLTMTAIILVAFFLTQNIVVLWVGMALIVCAILWMLFMVQLLGMRLSNFTSELCQILDDMMNRSQEPENVSDKETIFARIHHRLVRLYNILQESNRKVEAERQELQSLVSDISHQVRTPVSNMKMIVDTLLTKPLEEQERNEFLKSVRGQINKLDFLIQALVKTSRLETGVIQLEKEEHFLYDTLAQAMSGILYSAEQKKIHVSVECPEDLCVSHDSKWTEEAIFNLLDNAVKYTPTGGHVNVSVAQWEMYVEIKVSDTGKGISESNQASIFKRFYREEEIHNQPGVGIGLYLTREIVTQQGGYVTVESQVGKGSAFSIFLPR